MCVCVCVPASLSLSGPWCWTIERRTVLEIQFIWKCITVLVSEVVSSLFDGLEDAESWLLTKSTSVLTKHHFYTFKLGRKRCFLKTATETRQLQPHRSSEVCLSDFQHFNGSRKDSLDFLLQRQKPFTMMLPPPCLAVLHNLQRKSLFRCFVCPQKREPFDRLQCKVSVAAVKTD